MPETIKVSATFRVSAKRIYDAWLNSKEHSAMTGGKATSSTKIGGKFTVWDGYISGKNIELVKNKRIVQTWRGTDFPKESIDSILIIHLDETENGTTVTLTHTEIPEGMGKSYAKGWKDFYFNPMKKYFK